MSVNKNFKTKGERLLDLGIIREVLLEMLKEGYSPYKKPRKSTSIGRGIYHLFL